MRRLRRARIHRHPQLKNQPRKKPLLILTALAKRALAKKLRKEESPVESPRAFAA